MKRLLTLVVILFLVVESKAALTYEPGVFVETVAGSGLTGYLDGQGINTFFNRPAVLAVDQFTNATVWEIQNLRFRRVSSSGQVTTFAGSGTSAYADGNGTNASFVEVNGMAFDNGGNLLVSDGHALRRITPQGDVGLWAGDVFNGGYQNATRLTARFSVPAGVAVDSQGIVYVADRGNRRIRRIVTDDVSTFAGSGNSGTQDGNGIFCSFGNPTHLALDSAGNIYVSDGHPGDFHKLLRRISPSGDVVTVAGQLNTPNGVQDGIGTNATFLDISGLASDALGNIYVSDVQSIRKFAPDGHVTTLAGAYEGGTLFADGEGTVARFYGVAGSGFGPDGKLYLTDADNHRIRRMVYGAIPVAGFSNAQYAGLSIQGTIGRSYRIEFTDSLTPTNWTVAATTTLTNSPQVWIDLLSPTRPARFYRSVLLP